MRTNYHDRNTTPTLFPFTIDVRSAAKLIGYRIQSILRLSLRSDKRGLKLLTPGSNLAVQLIEDVGIPYYCDR